MQISFAVTTKLISAFVFATRIVRSLFFLNPKFQASNYLLWYYSLVCVGPGRKPRRPVFSQRGSFNNNIFRHKSMVDPLSFRVFTAKLISSQGYKKYSCSTWLSTKFILLITVKIWTFNSRINDPLSNWWFKPENPIHFGYFHIYEQFRFQSQLSWAWKKFHNLGTRCPDIEVFPVHTALLRCWPAAAIFLSLLCSREIH